MAHTSNNSVTDSSGLKEIIGSLINTAPGANMVKYSDKKDDTMEVKCAIFLTSASMLQLPHLRGGLPVQ